MRSEGKMEVDQNKQKSTHPNQNIITVHETADENEGFKDSMFTVT
jgi:hypothetical protein